MFSKHTSQAVLSAVLSGFLLSACGGGSGSDSQSSTTPNSNINSQQQTYAEIAGTAFSNKPLSDVKVNAICKDGSGFHADVVTDQEGQWKGKWMLRNFHVVLRCKLIENIMVMRKKQGM